MPKRNSAKEAPNGSVTVCALPPLTKVVPKVKAPVGEPGVSLAYFSRRRSGPTLIEVTTADFRDRGEEDEGIECGEGPSGGAKSGERL